METLDLHGIRHCDVDRHVENFVLMHQSHTPLMVICGNSQRMIDLVKSTLQRLHIAEHRMDRYGIIMVYRI
jgi:hypothetical protein